MIFFDVSFSFNEYEPDIVQTLLIKEDMRNYKI